MRQPSCLHGLFPNVCFRTESLSREYRKKSEKRPASHSSVIFDVFIAERTLQTLPSLRKKPGPGGRTERRCRGFFPHCVARTGVRRFRGKERFPFATDVSGWSSVWPAILPG